MELKILEEEVLKLNPRERAELAYKVLQSLEAETTDEIEEVWIQEALDRYKQLGENSKLGVSLDSVIREAKSKYK